MTVSLISLSLRLGVRTARVSLKATRDLAELGLATLDLVGNALGDDRQEPLDAEWEAGGEPERPVAPAPPPPRIAPAPEPAADAAPPPVRPAPVAPAPPRAAEDVTLPAGLAPDEPLPDDRELVEEVAEPGAEDGAGASLRVDPPFPAYDELRAADVIARLAGADMAELGETELYERTHRARRTVLEAIAREIRRRGPG